MLGTVFWVTIGLAIGLVLIAVIIYGFILRRGHQLGTRGLVQRSRLTCSKCGREFDYDWAPGASLTAVRLGTGRYMACPLCHKWSYFNLYDTMTARPPAPR